MVEDKPVIAALDAVLDETPVGQRQQPVWAAVTQRSRPAAQGPVENHVLAEDRLVFERVRKLARP